MGLYDDYLAATQGGSNAAPAPAPAQDSNSDQILASLLSQKMSAANGSQPVGTNSVLAPPPTPPAQPPVGTNSVLAPDSSASNSGGPNGVAGGIKGYLSDLFFNMGEQAKPVMGMPTLKQLSDSQANVDAAQQNTDLMGKAGQLASSFQSNQNPVFDTSAQAAPHASAMKRFLQGFVYNAGQAGLAAGGAPTDLERQKLANETANTNSEVSYRNAQANQMGQMITVQTPSGPITGPMSLLKNYLSAQVRAQATTQAATTAADSRKYAADSRVSPVVDTINQAKDALEAGDIDKYNSLLARAGEMSRTLKPVSPQSSETGLILRALQGGTDGAQAQQALDTLQNRRMQLVDERGKAFGNARLYNLQKVYDPETGQNQLMTGFQVLDAQKQGRALIPSGALSQKDIISVQQLQSEARPAIAQIKPTLTTFDNAQDKAVFAQVLKDAGSPKAGEEASWLGNVMDQALKGGALSPQGQNFAIAQGRLAESLGRLRSSLGLPATDAMMSLSLRLIPGATTPSSNYAAKQVDQLEQMINQAVNIPAYGGAPLNGTGNTKKSGGNAPTPPAQNVSPEGTIIRLPNNKQQIKRNGQWVDYTGK